MIELTFGDKLVLDLAGKLFADTIAECKRRDVYQDLSVENIKDMSEECINDDTVFLHVSTKRLITESE